MDWNNSKILAKETDYIEEDFWSPFLFILIMMLLMIKPIVFIQLLIIIKNFKSVRCRFRSQIYF